MKLEQFPRMTETEADRVNESEIWQIILKELEYRTISCLLQMKDKTDIAHLQAKIKVYEEMIALPEGVKQREQQQRG